MKLFLLLLIFGRYAEDENYFDITRGRNGAIHVQGEVHGPADQICYFEGDGELRNDVLYVPYDDVGGQCTLTIRFKDNMLITEDPDLDCRRAALCGSRVGLDGWELPLVTPPPSIFGRYRKGANHLDVRQSKSGEIRVTGNIRSCVIDGAGEWTGSALRVAQGEDCSLVLHFAKGRVKVEGDEKVELEKER